MFVLDSHCDTPSQICRLRDISLDNDHAQVDFPKLRRGGVDGVFFALYTSNQLESEAGWKYAGEMLDGVMAALAAASGQARLALSPEEALRNQAEGLISIFIGMENGGPIGRDLSRLELLQQRGVRYITLTHNGNNQICDAAAAASRGAAKWGGLSAFGREAVARMNDLGIMVDVSHISDASFWDVLACSRKPVIASHSCCRALSGHCRNLSDEMIRALAEAGGVIQINFYPVFLDVRFNEVLAASGVEERADALEGEFIADPGDPVKRGRWYAAMDELAALPRPSYKLIVDHVDHAVAVGGIDHVGLGSDFDGISVTPEGMESCADFPLIFEEMRRRGYSEADIEKVAGGNFLRVFGENLRG